jgi:hypothetical protein
MCRLTRIAVACFLVLTLSSGSGRADAQLVQPASTAELRRQLYKQLAKSPWRALGWELVVPGGGYGYTGLYAPAAVTLALTLAGASLWVAGSVRDRRTTELLGITTFAGARGYGLVGAPIGALLLNAAFRRQLGISTRF